MILAVDPGLASCGWAVVEQTSARVIDFGVITTEPDKAIPKSTDRARRAATLARELDARAALHRCDVISAESMLLFGNVNAATSQVLCWGALIALAHVHGMGVVEVRAKDWQHAVMPGTKKVSYPKLERALTSFVGSRIERIEKQLRTHALDAVGIGIYTALRPVARVTATRKDQHA